jgi:phosphoribosylformylglycinamidine synthase
VGPEPTAPSLGGSRWAWERGARGGHLEALDPAIHQSVAGLVRSLVADGTIAGVHDVAEGGLALALAESALAGGVGAIVTGVDGHAALFAESASRVLVSVGGEQLVEVHRRAEQAGVPARVLGAAGGSRLVVDGLVDVSLAVARERWRRHLPDVFGTAASH